MFGSCVCKRHALEWKGRAFPGQGLSYLSLPPFFHDSAASADRAVITAFCAIRLPAPLPGTT